MARGNQRELARAKNQKKQQEMSKNKSMDQKGANNGLTLEQRKQRDADRMREKQEKKSTETTGEGAQQKK